MDIKELINLISTEDVSFNLYFTRKLRKGYSSFSPNIDKQIFEDLINLIEKYINDFIDKEIIEYDPTGFKDNTIEKCETSYVGNFDEIIESFEEADSVDIEINPDNFTFYTLEILKTQDLNFPKIRIFRRVTKFKKLHSKGIIARFNGNQLNKLESKIIGIDGEVDFISVDTEIFVLSHYSLERIFKLDEKFKDKAAKFLNQKGINDSIENFDSFYEDCLNDARIRKTLTKMTNEKINIKQTYKNYDNIIKTIELFDLDIEYQENPNFVIRYESKEQIMDILRILRDSYYKSMINEQMGVDDK